MKNQEPLKENQNQPVDIVKIILDSRTEEKQAKKTPVDIPKEFTSEDFFLENNPHGLMRKATFKFLIDNLKAAELKEFKLVLSKLNANEYFEFSPVPYGNGPVEMLYAQISGWRGREKFKIPAVDNVQKFLSHYHTLRFQCSFSFEELYHSVK